jgi:hypothetical protein
MNFVMANINNVFVLKEIIAMSCGGLQLMVMRCSWIHATPMAMSLSDKMNMVNCGKKVSTHVELYVIISTTSH